MRVLDGLQSWPLSWLRERGVICYERAAGRIRDERGGRLDESFLYGVVKTRELPTAIANASGHYILLTPGCEPRYFTVEEVARAFQIPEGSPLMPALVGAKPLSAIQAVSCLGRSIHVGVARSIVLMLIRRGVLARGLSYGSAYSGIDTFAAAVDAELGGEWHYDFASEYSSKVRLCLLKAWKQRGLRPDMCFTNACSNEACTAPSVCLWVISPSCEPFSKRNRVRNEDGQRASLTDVWTALSYVRDRRPKVVVVENVCDVSIVGALTGLLSRIVGYSLECGPLDPRVVVCAPMARDRYFWVMVRDA